MSKTRAKVRFKEDRRGYDALQKELNKMKSSFVLIGVNEQVGQKKHPGHPLRQNESSEATIAEVAFFLEFGTSRMLERPFMRSSFDMNRMTLEKTRDALFKDIMAGKTTTKKALTKLGFMMKEFIQRRINSSMGWAEPLKPSTIAAKSRGAVRGPSTPLIDSGLLLRSIDFEVKE